MEDGIEAFDVGVGHVAHVFLNGRNGHRVVFLAKGGGLIQVGIETDNVMACLYQHRHQHRADIAVVSCH